MYIGTPFIIPKPKSHDPRNVNDILINLSSDDPPNTPFQSSDPPHSFIPAHGDPSVTTHDLAPDTTNPTSAATVQTRKPPTIISSHIGIFLSALVALCVSLIILYYLHGCFNRRPAPGRRSASAPAPAPAAPKREGLFGRVFGLRRDRGDAENKWPRVAVMERRPTRNRFNCTELTRAWWEPDLGVEMSSRDLNDDIPEYSLPQSALGCERSGVWTSRCQNTDSRSQPQRPSATANCTPPVDNATTGQRGNRRGGTLERYPSFIPFVRMPTRASRRNERSRARTANVEGNCSVGQAAASNTAQVVGDLEVDVEARTPPPRYEDRGKDELRDARL